jgi:hypothetical protein
LRVEVEDQRIVAMLPESGCQMQGDGRFSDAALLIDQCDCAHGRFPTSGHVNM